ncbi:MAG: nitrate reductase associated protein [Bacteroidota bacterium]
MTVKEMHPAYAESYHVSENKSKAENIFFAFEEDFVEDNVRCIPMIVRFKLDACGIKLKLNEWSKMSLDERNNLTEMPCTQKGDVVQYRNYLLWVIMKRAGVKATDLPVESNPLWANVDVLPAVLSERLIEFNWRVSVQQWRSLSNLQRFALMKLCKPGHENKNFPKAVKEFGLV